MLQGWGFAVVMWLLSRTLILVSMLLIAPLLAASGSTVAHVGDWRSLVRWDSLHYLKIATTGYEYANDGKPYIIAFFPILPLLMWGGSHLGISPELVGLWANNLAFLGALIVLYGWVNDGYGQSIARWAVAAAAWCPFSLFGTVLYTEGLFLLFSTAALRAFDCRQYRWAAVWGSLTTATRLPGLMLIPAFLLVSWKEQRSPIAYLSALASAGGVLGFSLFCGLTYGDPLAFVKVQKAWAPPTLGFGQGWLKSLVQITLGPGTWNQGRIADPLYPLAFLLICLSGYLLWHFRQKIGTTRAGYGISGLVLLLWLLAGSPFINVVTVIGGGYLVWHFRKDLRPVAVTYGLFSLALILSSGRTVSAERYAYGVVTLAMALVLLLAHYPRWGRLSLGFCAVLLVSLSLRFALNQWAG